MRSAVHYLPILTTLVAAWFAAAVFRRHRERGGTHLLWWGLGMVCYGAGTTTEALTTLFGWQAPVFRLWYITGALLGGAPLAQGTAYLLLSRRTANRLAVIVGAVVLAGALAVLLAPIRLELVEAHRLSGRVFEWQWVRLFSPFINLYAVTLLIGGAILSAVRYWKRGDESRRAVGNALIAVGAILPGIGGSFTRFGHVEVLYVTELVGLLVIYAGYRMIVSAHRSGAGRGFRARIPSPFTLGS
jgi:hypothetical protein